MALTELEIRKAKPKEKPYKLADGDGMYLYVHSNGGRYWRMDYRFGGKRKTLALGVYPEISLSEARVRRHEARKLLANDADPGALKILQKAVRNTPGDEVVSDSFEMVAREWFDRHKLNWRENHSSKIIARLNNDVFPWVGKISVREISPSVLLAAIRKIEARGALETAHRAMACCGQVFRYAVATGRADRDPTVDLRGALPPYKKDKHFAAITDPKKVGELLCDIDGYQGSYIVRAAFKLSPLLFVRPGELRSR